MHYPNGIWQSRISSRNDYRAVVRGPSSESKWRYSGERLLREMDSFDFIEAWDAAVEKRQIVPSVTTQMLIADAVTAHLTTVMSKKNAA
jgi:hypothetical protein